DATVGIRSALAMGATAAVHLSDPALAGSDALGTSKALAAAIRKTPFDLVLCATESSDSYTGLVPGQLAQLLGIPPLTFATALTVDGNVVTIKRQSEGGYDTVSAELPALVTVTTGINEPRYPTLKGIMGAKKKEIRKYTAADLGLGPGDVGPAGGRDRRRCTSGSEEHTSELQSRFDFVCRLLLEKKKSQTVRSTRFNKQWKVM